MGVEGVYKGKVQEKNKVEVQEKNKVENVYFNLVDYGDYVTLELVDENGNHVLWSNICSIDKYSGKIKLYGNVNRELGFTLDSHGCVIVD